MRSIKSVEEKKGTKLFEKIKEQENLNVAYEKLKNNLYEINNENLQKNIGEENNNYKGCIKNIEITNNFKLNKNNVNKNNESKNENNNNLILEINEKKSRNNNTNENKEINNEIINNINNTNQSKSNNYSVTNNTNDIIKISEDININDISLGLNEKNKPELSDNQRYPKSSILSERNEIQNKINENDDKSKINILKKIPENIIQDLTDDICQNILSDLISSEIKGKKKIISKKKKRFKYIIK